MRVRVDIFGGKIKGIFVGGCVERGEGSSFRAQAHAHDDPTDLFHGWVCVRGWKRLRSAVFASLSDPNYQLELLQPNYLLLHEFAHVFAKSRGHDDKWRRTMRALGCPIKAQYKKNNRKRWVLAKIAKDGLRIYTRGG